MKFPAETRSSAAAHQGWRHNLPLGFAMLAILGAPLAGAAAPPAKASNPIIHADVPDMSMIRVGNAYYMSSTTMHMNPGVPIMKSTDLVNWRTIGYAHEALDDVDELNLANDKNS